MGLFDAFSSFLGSGGGSSFAPASPITVPSGFSTQAPSFSLPSMGLFGLNAFGSNGQTGWQNLGALGQAMQGLGGSSGAPSQAGGDFLSQAMQQSMHGAQLAQQPQGSPLSGGLLAALLGRIGGATR